MKISYSSMHKAGSLIVALALVVTSVGSFEAFAAGGAIWTNTGPCGNPQNVNQYTEGEDFYIHASGFTPNTTYTWQIKDPGANGTVHHSGSETTDANGDTCFLAVTLTASDVGGPYQTIFGDKNDNFSVDAATPTTGTITIDKVVTGTGADEDLDFTFDPSWGGNVTLSDNDSPAASGAITAGTYTVSEVTAGLLTGWAFGSVVCTGDADVQYSGSTATIDLDAGEDVTCTFTNTFSTIPTPDDTTLTIVKQTTTDGDLTSFSFSGALGAFSLADNGVHGPTIVTAGAIQVAEATATPGYTFASASCVDENQASFGAIVNTTNGTLDLTLAAGDDVTCTFNNRENTVPNPQEGTIVVNKTVASGDTAQSFDFTTTGAGYNPFALIHGGSNSQTLAVGAYAVAETVPAGWQNPAVSCESNLNGTEDPSNIALDDDEVVTCTFTNTQDDNTNGGGGGGGGGTRGRSGSGGSNDTTGEVLGAQTEVMPLGAPATGAGGTAFSFASLVAIAGAALLTLRRRA